jgi:hypothetical protein
MSVTQRARSLAPLLALAAGCAGEPPTGTELPEAGSETPQTAGDDDDGTDSTASSVDTGDPVGPFQARTWAYDARSRIYLSVTDTDDLTACSLPTDLDDASPGPHAQQIVVQFDTSSDDCPAGLYNLTCDLDYGGEVAPNCAEFRVWSANGRQRETTDATGGAVRLSRAGSTACRFEVEVTFPGGMRFEDTFEIPLDSGDGPWCLQE